MSSFVRRLSRRLRRDEGGFTLVELLVTMTAGLVVLGGVVTVISVALQQTTYTFTRIDATERARTMLAHVSDEMHSACLVNGVNPIQGQGTQGAQVSDANNLVFVSAFGTSASPTPVEHKITYNATAGTLTEYTYNVTGTDPTKWTFASTPTIANGRLLLNHVAQIRTTGSNPTTLPVFQYFAYEPYTDVNGNPAMMLLDGTSAVPGTTSLPNPDPLSVTPSGLSATDASNAAEVMVNLLVGAQGGNFENTNLASAKDPVTDSLVLRFTPPPNAAQDPSNFGPCA